eukprot:TRINITY_DN12507_c0_g1_i1.p1 TRINITY_DN12507_c0_g1~~TRINITY_DN12507_c0_g1_i1.p1  ORF type:complete len:323 (+),score=-6.97 TRINITY_DN12507_c0_g1_i1:13-981(+)
MWGDTEYTNYDDDSTEFLILKCVSNVSASLSLIGASFIILTYIFIPKLRRINMQRLVFFMAIPDLCNAIGWLIVNPLQSKEVCKTLGVYQLFFFISSVLWPASIATEILYQFLWTRPNGFGVLVLPAPYRFEKFYHVISWGVPCIFIIEPAIRNRLSSTNKWCWFKNISDPFNFMFLGLVVLSLLYSLSVYIYIFSRRNKYDQTGSEVEVVNRKQFKFLVKRLTGYLLGFIYNFSMLPILSFALLIFKPSDDNDGAFVLWLMTTATLPLTGFTNSVVYGCSKPLKEKFMESVRLRRRPFGTQNKYSDTDGESDPILSASSNG